MKYRLIALCLLVSGMASAQNVHVLSRQNEKKIAKASQSGLASFLNNIPEGREADFGYASRSEIKQSAAGKPIQMLVLSKDFYTATAPATENYITESSELRVPVLVAGKYKNLLTVVNKNSKYTAGDIGGAALAQELQLRMTDKSAVYYMLRVYRLHADILVKSATGSLTDATFIPLASAVMAIPAMGNGKQAFTMKETLTILKQALNNHPIN